MCEERRALLDKMYGSLEAAMQENGIHERIIKGEGEISAKIALIGEAPGGTEELLGKPFVGAAGKKLDGFLNALELTREELFLTNVVKWRPKRNGARKGTFANRPPTKREIELCSPFLFEEIKIVAPEIVVTLGNVALRALVGDASVKIGELHGRSLSFAGLTVFPLYHPASVIYSAELNSVYESDLEILKNVVQRKLTKQ